MKLIEELYWGENPPASAPVPPEYWEAAEQVSQLLKEIETVLGAAFREKLWDALSRQEKAISLDRYRRGIRLGLRLALAVLDGENAQ